MDLRERLRNAIGAYYRGDQNSEYWIDDEQYEELLAQFKSESGMSEDQIEQFKKDSIKVIDKIKHKWLMGTLSKVHELAEIKKNDEWHCIWNLKYDGCSVEIHYDENGGFDYACTRGDYVYGENRTALIERLIDLGIVESHYDGIRNACVRGELLVSDQDWMKISDIYKNQRNAASGICNRDDFLYAECLTFIPYDVIDDKTGKKSQYSGKNAAQTFSSYDEAKACYDKHTTVPTDGLVFKAFKNEDMTDQQYAVAYKFSDQAFKTRIRDVRWQMGKTGKLTPVAVFDMVFIDAEVTKASLGSYAIFKNFDFHYNDEILVKKANQIIPQVIENLGGGSKQKIEAPVWWNGKKAHVEGAALFAENDARWKDIMWSQISNLTGKGIGPSFMERCIQEYGVTTFSEFCEVVFMDSFHIPRIAGKTVRKARAAILEAKKADLVRFIAALGLDKIGWKNSEKLCDKLDIEASRHNEDPVMHLLQLDTPYEFAYAISGIGDSTARSFADNYGLICQQLESWYRVFGKYPELAKKAEAHGPKVVITGTFNDGMKRKDVTAELQADGFDVVSRVTSDVKFLIAGHGGGSKRSVAESLKVKIIETRGDLNVALNELKKTEKS